MSTQDFIAILQMAIGPVILISGVGLLLLSMTNRFGRVTDRCRAICETLRNGSANSREHLLTQLRVFEHRARLIRLAILFAGTSVLFAAILVIALFAAVFFNLDAAIMIALLFVTCMASLICSLMLFLRDINVSLSALKPEIESAINGE